MTFSNLFFCEQTSELSLLFPEGNFWELFKERKELFLQMPLGCHKSTSFNQVAILNPESVYIGSNVKIEPFVTIEGPCYIADNVTIRSGAYIRPYSFIDKGALVGHATEVKASFLLAESKAPHKNSILDSLIGAKVNLGALVTCANLRLDQKTIKLYLEDVGLWDSGMKKLGALIGHNACVGCLTLLNPGTIIAPKTLIPPQSTIKGSHHALIPH